MKISVDHDKCQGHNRCKALAPDLFELDELGYASAIDGGAVQSGEVEKARLAVSNCPEFAIEIIED